MEGIKIQADPEAGCCQDDDPPPASLAAGFYCGRCYFFSFLGDFAIGATCNKVRNKLDNILAMVQKGQTET